VGRTVVGRTAVAPQLIALHVGRVLLGSHTHPRSPLSSCSPSYHQSILFNRTNSSWCYLQCSGRLRLGRRLHQDVASCGEGRVVATHAQVRLLELRFRQLGGDFSQCKFWFRMIWRCLCLLVPRGGWCALGASVVRLHMRFLHLFSQRAPTPRTETHPSPHHARSRTAQQPATYAF
jgi:hypothetical protein